MPCFPLFHRFLKTLSLILVIFFSAALSHAQNLGGDSLFAVEQDEFLEVHEAYITSGNIDGQQVSFTWQIEDGYYLYRHRLNLQMKTAKQTIDLNFSVPDGLRKFDEVFQEELEVYYQSLNLRAELPETDQAYELLLGWQGCADAGLCYQPQVQIFKPTAGTLALIPASEIIQASNSKASNPAQATAQDQPLLVLILLGAIVGGMILNLMPCVFPVLSLKALSLASGNASQHRINGWAYTAGVVISFIFVAIIIVSAKSAGTTLGWGFQLQEPIFVAALVYLFFLLGMNLFGLFDIGTSWMGLGNTLTQGKGLGASFFTGILAAVVASPCTAPFMATAVGFTLTQSTPITLLVFICLGFGMALPYLLLSHSPALAGKLPQPGPWMDTFKQLLAFPLLFTCVWLLVVVGEQTSSDSSAMLVGGAIALAMAFWLWKKQPASPWRWAIRLLAIVLAASALNIAHKIENFGHSEGELWQEYSPALLDELRSNGTPVFVDLTADWCITCKINERVALDTEKVMNFAQANEIAMLRGDWTSSDPEITELLNAFQRNGVPLYLMYPSASNSEPEVLPQILTKGIVLDAMKRALTP